MIVTRALSVLENYLGKNVHDVFRLAVGTSTGSIISAGIAAGFTAQRMTELYIKMGNSIFPDTLRKKLFPLTRYRYPVWPLHYGLNTYFGDMKMGDVWKTNLPTDLVITTYDLEQNRTRFIKPWKVEYEEWLVSKAIQASCTVPTYFPVVENRFIDGGVGSYSNPCYIAAYEARECLDWELSDTTLISIGTGRCPYAHDTKTANRLWAWDWIGRTISVFSQSAYDQQVHLVRSYFQNLDFRRFQVNLRQTIEMDDTSQMDQLLAYGSRLGHMIINDKYDFDPGIVLKRT